MTTPPADATGATTLDRIVTLTQDDAVAVRNIPHTLAVFDTHFPRFPVLPGVMILATMAELAAALLQHRTGRQWCLEGAEHVRYRHFVRPGDQLKISVVLQDLAAGTARLSATATVDEAAVTTARSMRMVPA
jgi:3-hydroxyacyl-[acyl-carrier-protein] dehydratase